VSDLDAVVQEVVRGDRERYRAIVEACEVPVRVVLAAMLPDAVPVDDVVHEVFLTAYLKLREYRTGTDLVAWLKAIARNMAHNERRRFARQQAMKRRYRDEIDEVLAPAVEEAVAGAGAEALAALRDCVEALAEPARALVRRHYFDGVGYDEIARASGRTSGWARLVLFRARAAIARCLSVKGELGPWTETA